MRRALRRRFRAGPAQEAAQHGEVVLPHVDRRRRIVGGRPHQPRSRGESRVTLEADVIRHRAGHGAQHVEGVERRHAGAGLADVESWIGQPAALGGGADGQAETHAFGGDAILLRRQAGADGAAGAVEQQRILAAALREDALGEADDEDDVEGAAAQPLRRGDEDAAEPLPRRLAIELRQPRPQDTAHLGQRHRSDGRHRPQIGEQLEDAHRMPEGARRQRRQPCQPVAPRRLRRQRGELVDEREREAPQVVQGGELAPHGLAGAASRLLRFERPPAQIELGVQAAQASVPARGPAAWPGVRRHGGIDEQGLPAPRRADVGALDRRRRRRRGRVRLLDAGEQIQQRELAGPECLVARGDEGRRRRIGPPGRRIAPRHLAERQVFGEAARRQVVGGAGEQRQEGAAGRIGPPRAAREPGRHPGPLQRLLERPPVALRRPHDDRHPVEGHAARRLVEDPPGDLGRLTRLAGRREERDAVVRLAGRGLLGEQVAADAGQGGVAAVVAALDRIGESRRQERDGAVIAGRDGRQHGLRPGRQGGHEVALGGAGDRHVEQQQRARRQAGGVAGGEPCGRRLEQRRAIGEAALLEQRGVALAERRQVRCGRPERGHLRRADARLAQLAERLGQGPRQARAVGNRGEGVERGRPASARRAPGSPGRPRPARSPG